MKTTTRIPHVLNRPVITGWERWKVRIVSDCISVRQDMRNRQEVDELVETLQAIRSLLPEPPTSSPTKEGVNE
jgi:hypothetical protein